MGHFTEYPAERPVFRKIGFAVRKGTLFKKIYVAVMLWFVGRAVQAASRVDSRIKQAVESLPKDFSFSLGVFPAGPSMMIQKLDRGVLKYRGPVKSTATRKPDLEMQIKHLEAAVFLFTFQESTCVSTARNRLIVSGDVPASLTVVRILDAVEVYLLPGIIAELAVKRYPDWPLTRKLINRTRIYFRTVAGY